MAPEFCESREDVGANSRVGEIAVGFNHTHDIGPNPVETESNVVDFLGVGTICESVSITEIDTTDVR